MRGLFLFNDYMFIIKIILLSTEKRIKYKMIINRNVDLFFLVLNVTFNMH